MTRSYHPTRLIVIPFPTLSNLACSLLLPPGKVCGPLLNPPQPTSKCVYSKTLLPNQSAGQQVYPETTLSPPDPWVVQTDGPCLGVGSL